ncbi:MAG: PASTA domain-containing protein, partial [Clostridiales bacterium]|nr:PASTA domain-containing protein [Clostridiales bacterium]
GAYGVVMDVETGAILAMSTKPDYDLNNPWLIDYEKTRNTVDAIANEDEKKEARSNAIQSQWRNSVISDTYETGSVFKVFVAAAALEEGIVSVDDKYTCTGSITVADRIMRCHNREGHGLETFVQGLENSCNPFFITVGQKLGAEKFFEYFEAFGFTEKTGIDLPGEANSIYVEEENLGLVELSSASFGQTNSLTPIQVVTALSAIANGGKLMQPYVVAETLDGDGNTVSKTSPTVKRQVISEETSETVLSMMESVVLNGTGKNGYVAGYSVGGKTGTSTKLSESNDGKTRYLASFAAVAPIDDPKIAVLIIIDEPNEDLGGGALAAPIAAQVIEQALQELGVEPKYTEEELENLQIETPNLVGRDVDAAKDTLTINALKANVVGDGDTVVRQQPAAGSKIPSGGTVVLYTETDSEDRTVEVPDFTGKTVTQVNAEAAAAGLNIQLSGKSLSENDVVSYKQSVEAGKEVEVGTVVTVYFKHTTGITDSAQ